MKQTAYIALLAVLTFTPAAALAATVTVADDTTIILPSDSSNYTISSGSTFDFLTVNTSSFTFDMSTGETVTITSNDRKTLTTNPATTATCGTNQSSVVLTVPSTISSQTVEVTPSGTCSSTSNASSNTGGGGTLIVSTPPASSGGGSPPPPPPPPAPVPTPTPAPATPSSSAPGQTPAPKGASSVIPALVQSVFFKNLSPGMRGDSVRELQALLRQDKTLYPEGIANGVFGPATVRAVKRFQKKYDISQTGTTGPLTRAKLMQVFGETGQSLPTAPAAPFQENAVFAKNLVLGSRNDDVRRLQQLLSTDASIYAEGIINGNFGPATLRAVKKFQQKYGITPVNGRVGPLTREKLREAFGTTQSASPAPPPSVVPTPAPTSSTNIQALQGQLTELLKQLEELQKKKK